MIENKLKNITVWGVGPHAEKNIIPAIKKNKKLNLYGICTRDKKILKNNVSKYNCKGWSTEKEMLKDKDIDIVFLCTPIGLHANQGKKILLSGKHLWCEKPFTTRLEDTEELISISENENLMIGEGFMYIYHPHFIEIKKTVDSGDLGKIISINIKFGIPFLQRPGFRLDPDLAGGAFWDVGTYPISAAISLFPNRVYEVISSDINFDKKHKVDISGKSTIIFHNGPEFNLEWAIGSSYRNDIDIWGQSKSIYSERIFSKMSDYQAIINVRDKTGNIKTKDIISANHFDLMFKDFVESIDSTSQQKKHRKEIRDRSIAFSKVLNLSKIIG